ncbi:MAG: peptidylprolyl isomerase [Thiovulaceae bacterium]|nr:peptidylprolyl isomerase [Sulfurimonadaceae bacterium]
MKKTLLALMLSASTMFAATVAEVNGQKIDDSALMPAIQQITRGNYARLPAEQQAEARRIALEDAIGQVLIQEQTKKDNIKSTQAFKTALKETIERIEPQLATQVWMKKEFEKMVVGSKEVKKFYNENKEKFNAPKQVHARHILVKKESEAKVIIKKLMKISPSKLKAAFIESAKANSTGPSAKTGGDLGFFKNGAMVPAFNTAVFKMKKNTITTKPVKTKFGFHVIYLEDIQGGAKKSFAELKPKVEQALKAQKFQVKLKALVEKLKSKAKISYK